MLEAGALGLMIANVAMLAVIWKLLRERDMQTRLYNNLLKRYLAVLNGTHED